MQSFKAEYEQILDLTCSLETQIATLDTELYGVDMQITELKDICNDLDSRVTKMMRQLIIALQGKDYVQHKDALNEILDGLKIVDSKNSRYKINLKMTREIVTISGMSGEARLSYLIDCFFDNIIIVDWFKEYTGYSSVAALKDFKTGMTATKIMLERNIKPFFPEGFFTIATFDRDISDFIDYKFRRAPHNRLALLNKAETYYYMLKRMYSNHNII